MDALKKWRVRAITTAVPVLLQLALIVFIIGLLILLWNLHPVVASVASAFAGALFLFLTVVTILPAYRWDCCYRAPQALMVFTVIRLLRNNMTDMLQRCIRFCSTHRRREKRLVDAGWAMLQRCCGLLSRTTPYRTWQAQERRILRDQSHALNIETAVTAYTTTLEPQYLDHVRVVLSGEPGLPLVQYLNVLEVGIGDGSTDLPVSLLKRNARDTVARLILHALRQLLTVEQEGRADLGFNWEAKIKALFNTYLKASEGSPLQRDSLALRTAFLISIQTSDADGRLAALRHLADAVDADSPVPCQYSTISHILSAAEQWIEREQAKMTQDAQESKPDEKAHSGTLPQINMTAFNIVVHCMLRVVEQKTSVPEPQQDHFSALCDRARAALKALPSFLPPTQALLDSYALCDQFSFGMKLLLTPLARLSRAMDKPHAQDTARHTVDTPSPILIEVVAALEGAWDTACVALKHERRPSMEPGTGITARLESLTANVDSLFKPLGFGGQICADR
ncbi:hypothetical protein C8Q77DRAFT_1061838 [Trametes polyzona]|nr:hypothetical protein C8Q77DRAFT_1061838 [Trametes polyzona]